jgi:hypothetical protein
MIWPVDGSGSKGAHLGKLTGKENLLRQRSLCLGLLWIRIEIVSVPRLSSIACRLQVCAFAFALDSECVNVHGYLQVG